MIYALFGLPGSGKSYLAVKQFIIDRIENETIISNIKLSSDYTIPDSYIYLDKEDVNNLNKNIKNVMSNENYSHDEKKLKLEFMFSLYGKGDITLIYDEAHLYGFRGRSSSDSWADDFLSIHRHCLGLERKLDIVLITQVPTRLNAEIASQVEVAIKALPSSQRIIKSFLEYKHFGSVDALKKNDKTMLLKSEIVKGDSNVFSLYESGYANEGSNAFRKKMIMVVIAVILVFGFVIRSFYNMVTGSSSGVLPSDVVPTIENNVTDINGIINSDIVSVNSKYYTVRCLYSNTRLVEPSKIKNYFYSIEGGEINEYCFKDFTS